MDVGALVIIYNICLAAGCVFLSFFVTPWALLGLLFVAGWRDHTKVMVEQDGTTVEVSINPDAELDEGTIKASINSAMEQVDGS